MSCGPNPRESQFHAEGAPTLHPSAPDHYCRNESCAGADANLFCSAPHKSTRIRFQCLVQTYTGEATGEWCDRTRQICPSFHTLLCTNSSLQHAQEKNVCLTCVSHVTRPPFCSRWGGERIACLRWHGPCGIDGARLQQTSRGSHAPKHLYFHPLKEIVFLEKGPLTALPTRPVPSLCIRQTQWLISTQCVCKQVEHAIAHSHC